METRRTLYFFLMTICASSRLTAGDWPAFRGPQGDGTAQESGLPREWGPDRHIKWKAALPAPGNGSPIVSNGRVFVTYAQERGQQRHLACFDRTNGEQLWIATVPYGKVEETHETNPYCGSTPLADGERVFVWHGSAGMHCYDFDGNVLWSRDLGEFEHIWGYGSSPIRIGDTIIQLCGPGERTRLAALRADDGEVLWETPEPGCKGKDNERYVSTWGTPVVIDVQGRKQLLIGMPTRAAAYDSQTGKLEWFVTGISSDRADVCYTSPLVSGDAGVVLGGYHGPGVGFTLGGSGDVTNSNVLWKDIPDSPPNPQRIGTGVVLGEHVFMANADGPGSIECFDLRTGKSRWQERRTADGPHWGSIVSADGRLYVTGQKGVTTVFAPNPDRYELIAENDLGERTNSTPAVSNGEIFLRTFEHLYCISE
ncbi:MAG: PQQ-binding-like beta-propeller repeat protein [Planctomycetaceae bacterium]